MEQPPRFRDQLKEATLGALVDAAADTKAEWQWKAQIGDQVVHDCGVWGLSIWRRKEDGTIESLDPSLVKLTVVEPIEIPPGGSFPAHRISDSGSESSISSAKMWQRPE